MKTIITALLLITLASCTKDAVTAPAAASQTIAANKAVSYKDNSISVINFKAQATNNAIAVTFTTLYEKDIASLEILKGLSANNLCSIYKQRISSNSYATNQYSTNDTNDNNASDIYYMVKYTLQNGDWGYTPVFKLCL